MHSTEELFNFAGLQRRIYANEILAHPLFLFYYVNAY